MPRPLPRRDAFTLIELLVVISVIMVLLALLMPALGRAKEAGRRAACQSNLRQWFIATETYGYDSSGYYPGITGLGQNSWAQDFSYTPNYMSYQWEWDANRGVTQYVAKSMTLCPSQDPGWAPKTWYNAGTASDPKWWGYTDYSIKASFGSNHIATNPTGYDDPGPANWWSFRGHYDWRFPRRAAGFNLNFRQEQDNRLFGKPQSLNSIMFMDRSRSPNVEAQDGSIYQILTSNHAGNLPRGGAEITNVVLKSGQVRAMNMAAVWAKGDYSMNYYDITGYGEGSYPQYVDDEIASQWW